MNDISVNEKLKSNYDEYYEGVSAWRELSAIDKAANVIALCDKIPHNTVLDIGSGDGALIKRLSDIGFGHELYSLEISTSAIDIIIKRNIPRLVECKLFDGSHIPYENRRFDLAILSHVVEHIEYPRMILREAGRVADYVFVEVPLELNIRLPENYKWDKVGHINFYCPKTIRRLLQTIDFEVLLLKVINPSYSVYKYRFGKRAIFRFLPKEVLLRVLPSLATSLYTYHCAILCRNGRA